MTQVEPLTGTPEEIKDQLRAEFGAAGWSIIYTRDTHRWWGCRGPLIREDLNKEASTSADTPEELRLQIHALMESQ